MQTVGVGAQQAGGDNFKASLWLLASATLFTASMVLVKTLGDRLSPFQIAFFRLSISLIVISPFLIRAGRAAGGVHTSVPFLQIGRGVMGTLATILGFYAVVHLPLADAQAISFARTLFVVPLAALILSETIGLRRWMAVLIGFVGVLIMLRPGGDAFSVSIGSAAALGHAFFVGFATVLVRLASRYDKPVTLMFYTGIVGTLVSAVPAYFVWVQPTGYELLLLLCMGSLAAAAHNCFIRAYAIGEASAIAPLDYTRLILAAIAGLIFFDQFPDLVSWLGAFIIAASSIYIVRREAKLGRGAPPTP